MMEKSAKPALSGESPSQPAFQLGCNTNRLTFIAIVGLSDCTGTDVQVIDTYKAPLQNQNLM